MGTIHLARQGAQACPGGLCSPRPTSGAHLLVYKSFLSRKNKERTFGTKRRRLEAELGQEHFCPLMERFRWGGLPSRWGKSSSSSSPTTLPSWGGQYPSTSSTEASPLKTLFHLLYPILYTKPQIGTCGLLVVWITPCSDANWFTWWKIICSDPLCILIPL